MNNKNIIIAGAIAIGLYLFSQTKKIRYTTTAQKVAPKRTGQPTTWAEHIAALRKATAQKIGKKIGKTVAQKVAVRKATAQKIGKKIGKTVAQKVAQKKVASWKAPYRFPNAKFRVITPSDILKNLAKKVQKTTPSTPSNRRKRRLRALFGSHWQDIWIQRQKRR